MVVEPRVLTHRRLGSAERPAQSALAAKLRVSTIVATPPYTNTVDELG